MAVQNQNLPTKTTTKSITTKTATSTSNATKPMSKTRTKFGQAASAATSKAASSATTTQEVGHTNKATSSGGGEADVEGAAEQAPTTSTMPLSAGAAANGGPRVSFNRDVHVKRIGKHPNELTNYETTNLQPPQATIQSYHQVSADLSEENIRKEAALVLAQAERHKSKAENGDNIPTFKVRTKRSGDSNAKKFHSLPTRKKKGAAKPVSRSVSDAAAKKNTKRPSIFGLFSRRSDTNINQVERDPLFEDSGGIHLVRSKSDVGSYNKEERKQLKKSLKDAKLAATQNTNNNSKQKLINTPLSPILENAQKEDYFEKQFNRERRKSDAITEREKHESGVSELLERSRKQAVEEGNIIGKGHISHGIRDKILTLQSKSQENMHSSQLPAKKLPLTRGVTVNGLAKRLSMERFSPPPPLSSPAFSYIRPNEGIMYAQLDHNEDPYYQRRDSMHSPIKEMRSPLREYRSPARDLRDMRSPEREIPSTSTTLGRQSVDRTDFATSQNNIKNAYNYSTHNGRIGNSNGSRVIIEPSTRAHDNYGSAVGVVGPTTIRITNSHSPSPWQQLSPRNVSDEDEGLGIETRKYYEDEPTATMPSRSSKSPAEPPIVPVIRSITPTCESNYNARVYKSPPRDEPMDDIGYRRARLESRILTRRFGEPSTLERNGYHREVNISPERNYEHNGYHHNGAISLEHNREVREESMHHRYLSPERERVSHEPRFHKMETSEILNKYSPERSHLDIIAPTTARSTTPKLEKTSRYKHTKYYDDGRGGVKEVYERETHLDAQGKPIVRESHHRERMDGSVERQQLQDYEPKSLDSQITGTDQYRSSPENMKHYEINGSHVHDWHGSSLKRDKLQQRSFDKGDSGIENDFRKESFNGDLTSRWRKRTAVDDIKACEAFLRKERRHIEQLHVAPRKDNYVYRERSIDDGSHYDPHLDKYPVATNTLRRKDQQSQTANSETLKRTKKLGGFEKVKQLFTGVSAGGGSGSGSEGGKSSKKESERKIRGNSSITTVTANTSVPSTGVGKAKGQHDSNGEVRDRDRYMVKEEEMRSRYTEHRGSGDTPIASRLLHDDALREPKATDISMRRRLSTPKASPLLLKRTSSDKPKKESPLAKPEKTSWFKSLDRRSKSKSKEKLDVSVNGQSESSTMKRTKNSTRNTSAPLIPPKNLRFFGDTDIDSNPPTITKAKNTVKTRASVPSTLNRSQKYSQSAYNLDRLNANPQQNDYRRTLSSSTQTSVGGSRHKSSSMHNLENGVGGVGGDEVDFRKRRHYSRSRDLDDISETGSETEDQNKRPNGVVGIARSLSREHLDRSHRYDDHTYRRSSDCQGTPLTMTTSTSNGVDGSGEDRDVIRAHHMMVGPPKPARSAERRTTTSYSRELDRFPAESSGTEGESSLHSQRSVVYLHATTVGAIPQPYHLRRRSISRDDLRSNKSKPQPLQPMTRTVSRSVSMLAPWKPKFVSEGYEINYSQEQNKRLPTMPRKPQANSSNILTRTNKKSETSNARTLRRHDHLKDDQSSLRHSSTTSASKSALSSNIRSADGRRKVK
ncbi:uncharacterized protein blo [Eurosta solidaginis]|uniref:uncharacterized protein blo n=1 Tax=Eurosta solidaginis TaxID=178769 RepID=UPI0035311533